MEQEQAYLDIAKRLYPVAALYLGSLSEGRAAITEAIAAACRKDPAVWEHEVLPQLLRICSSRAPERIAAHDFPSDPALAPLLPVLKLPVSSRRNLALSLCVTTVDAAAAREVSIEEMEHKIEKAFRQLTFMQSGEQPEPELLAEAAKHLPWNGDDTKALLRGLAESRRNADAADTATRSITQSAAPAPKKQVRQVTLPLWGIVFTSAAMLVLVTVLLVQVLRNQHAPRPEQREAIYTEEVDSLFSEEYLSVGTAQSAAAKAAGIDETAAVWVTTKLKPDEAPPAYEITFRADSVQYTYTLDAKTGSVLSQSQMPTENIPEWRTDDWLTGEQLRAAALAHVKLHNALILREKYSADGDSGSCKYVLLDEDGNEYTVQLDVKTGRLLKYDAEQLTAEEPENIISAEEAKTLALARVSGVSPTQVIYTKVKLDSGAYRVAFTLDDGTQYVIELNAETGAVNATDVHPVSADTSQAIGLLAARDIALEMAELQNVPDVTFTKAKIDRSSGNYVYELEFETPQCEYEITLNTQTGEVLKYRAWEK